MPEFNNIRPASANVMSLASKAKGEVRNHCRLHIIYWCSVPLGLATRSIAVLMAAP